MIRRAAVRSAYRAECAATAWWDRMGAREQEAYLRAHPASKMGKRGHALVRTYLGTTGPERTAAGNALTRAGVPLPEEPVAPRSERYQRETVRNPHHRPAGEHPQDAQRRHAREERERAEAEARRRAEQHHAENERRREELRREKELRRAKMQERQRNADTLRNAQDAAYSPGAARSTRGTGSWRNARMPSRGASAISSVLQRHFGAGSPNYDQGHAVHALADPQMAVRLHAHLAERGWLQSKHVVRGVTHHVLQHPDGGYVVTRQVPGQPLTVHVHGDD